MAEGRGPALGSTDSSRRPDEIPAVRPSPYRPASPETHMKASRMPRGRLRLCQTGLAGARLLRRRANGFQVLPDPIGEDTAPRHEDVRARLRDDRRSVDLDASVHFHFDVEALLIDVRSRLADLRHDLRAERLAREPRMDRHHEKETYVRKVRHRLLERRRGIEDQPWRHPRITNGANRRAD